MNNTQTLNDIGKYNKRKAEQNSQTNILPDSESQMLLAPGEGFEGNCFQATVSFVCPYFEWKSATFVFAVICVFGYIAEWMLHSKYDWTCATYKLGAMYLPAVQRYYHFHRFLLAVLLHSNFFHLLWNVLALVSLGNSCEHFLTTYKFVPLLLISAIGGNLLSACFSDKCGVSVGASGCIMGILGFQVAWTISTWKHLGNLKYVFIAYLVVIT